VTGTVSDQISGAGAPNVRVGIGVVPGGLRLLDADAVAQGVVAVQARSRDQAERGSEEEVRLGARVKLTVAR
jgi:hypothetical protein